MIERPVHTPYDGSGKLFQIGLSLLGPSEWIETDSELAFQLGEKQRLERLHPAQIFAEMAASRPAQEECLALLIDDLKAHHAATHYFDGNQVEVAGMRFDLADSSVPPLKRAARMVQEDLLILDRREAGWHLVAASLSFPSSWSLTEKIGRSMDDIHESVPYFGSGTRNATMINRIFDKLPVEAPVKRMNWSINNTPALYLPGSKAGKDPGLKLEDVHVRVERQTLRKLAKTGAIVFSIRIHVDRLDAIMASPRARDYADSFAAQILALDGQQAAYKGFADRQQALAEHILARAGKSKG